MHRLFLLVFSFLLQFQIGHSRSTGCTEGDCNNGTGTWNYTDLTIYFGEWLDSKKHGKGMKLISSNAANPMTTAEIHTFMCTNDFVDKRIEVKVKE